MRKIVLDDAWYVVERNDGCYMHWKRLCKCEISHSMKQKSQKGLDLELIELENFESGTIFWDNRNQKQFNKNMLIQTFYCKKNVTIICYIVNPGTYPRIRAPGYTC